MDFYNDITKELKKVNISAKFDIIKRFTGKSKKIIKFSISLFRLIKPYKNEHKYTDGIIYILEKFPHHFPNMCLLIYIDDSIKKDNKWDKFYNIIINSPYTEIVKYNFKQFKENAVFHDSLFGTILRMLPIFNFGNVNKNEIIVILDADYEEKNIIFGGDIDDIKKRLNIVLKTNTDILLTSYNIYASLDIPRLIINDIIDKNFIYTFLISPTIFSIKLDKNIFIDFIYCMFTKCKSYNEWIDNIFSNINCNTVSKLSNVEKNMCNDYFKIKKVRGAVFIFGIDEFFFNNYIVGYLLKNEITFTFSTLFPNMAEYHYFIYNTLYKEKKLINKSFMIQFYKEVLKDQYSDDIEKNYSILDIYIYKTKKNNYFDTIDLDNMISDPVCKKYHRLIYTFLSKNIKKTFDKIKNKYHVLCLSLLTKFTFSRFIKNKTFYRLSYGYKKNDYITTEL